MKYRLLLIVCLLVGFSNKGWGNSTDYFGKVTVKASPTGAGKVYAAKENTATPRYVDPGVNGKSYTFEQKETHKETYPSLNLPVYLYASPNQGYLFLNWTEGNGKIISSDNPYSFQKSINGTENEPTDVGTYTANFFHPAIMVAIDDASHGTVSISNLYNKKGENVTISANNSNTSYKFDHWTNSQDANFSSKEKKLTLTNSSDDQATYTAHYVAFSNPSISVKSNDASLGIAGISNYWNWKGESVTLIAQPIPSKGKFQGWKKDGEDDYISTESRFVVSNNGDQAVTYIAYFSSDSNDGYYWVTNVSTGNNAVIANDTKLDYYYLIGSVGGGLGSASSKVDLIYKAMNDKYLSQDINMGKQKDYTDVSGIFYLENKNNSKYNVGNQGTSLDVLAQGTYEGSVTVTFQDNYMTFTPKGNCYRLSLKPNSDYEIANKMFTDLYFYDDNGNFALSSSQPADYDDSYQWWVEPVEYFCVKPMNEKIKDDQGNYWTTLTTAFPYTIPEGSGVLGAYTVSTTTKKEDGKTYAELTTLAKPGETVPAETPVLLKLSSADAAQNKLVPTGSHAVGNSSKKVTKNLLSGVYLDGKEKNNTTKYRVLGVSPTTGKIGFFKLSSTVAYMGANKAFLELPATAGAKGGIYIDFDNTDSSTTGIINVQNHDATNKGDAVYDLQGRRVTHPQHGVYIIKGKKVFVK